eukprot:s1541_g21.t1
MADSGQMELCKTDPVKMGQVLQEHRYEMFEKLDVWLHRVEVMLQEHVKKGVETAQLAGPDLDSAEEAVLSRSLSITWGKKRRNSRSRETGSSDSDADGATNSADLARMISQHRLQHATEAEEVTGKMSETTRDLTRWQSMRAYARMLVNSHVSNAFFALVVLTNSLYLGVQLEYHAVAKDSSADTLFLYIHIVYAVLFTVEVGLRLLADGFWKYFCASEWAWNLLDVFIVSSSWIELIIDVLTPGTPGTPNRGTNTNLRLIRLLRVGRLFRVVRIIRVVRLFRSLRTLVQSLVGTLKTLFWALLLLFLIMYIFGILFTDAVLDHVILADLAGQSTEVSDQAELYFGALSSSITTLFRTISDGLTWHVAADTLRQMELGEFWVQVFHFYVAFVNFAVLNVMTGVFCNSAIKAAESDHEMVVQTLVQTRQELKDLVTILFSQIDKRGNGQITFGEFEEFFRDEAVKAFFESLQIGAMDAWTLFVSLDMDGDSYVSVEEFTERCLQLHGPARSADLFALRHQAVKMGAQLRHLEVELRQVKKQMDVGFSL